ncbi:MAG TPA: ABC transporter substrate-binding protein, partial [Candidatus Bathyarchaeia archaeon]|nr:ABC transporter substrate-binding protein [Candidatus Bathyarchaeia archaeon]
QYPWINNKLVRQAFSRAIDRDTIIKTVLGGLTVPEYGPISVTDKAWYDPQITKYTYDPAMANSLLDQAGYPKGSDGTRFSAPMVVYLSSLPFAQVIQQELLAVGIKLTVTPVEDVTFFAQYETGPRGLDTYPIGLQTFGAGPLPANMFNWSNAAQFSPKGQNCGFYNNTQVNQLEDQASSTLDTNQAHQLVNQIQEIMSADVGYVFLWAHWKIVAFKSNIVGVVQNSLPISWYGPGYRDVYRTGVSSVTSSTSVAEQPGLTSTMPTIAIIIVVLLIVAGAVIAKRKKRSTSS